MPIGRILPVVALTLALAVAGPMHAADPPPVEPTLTLTPTPTPMQSPVQAPSSTPTPVTETPMADAGLTPTLTPTLTQTPVQAPSSTPTPVVEHPMADRLLTSKEIVNSPELTDEEVTTALLDRYPEAADKSAKEKLGVFRDAIRGLLVWDFFDGKLTVRGHTRIQVDATLANGDSTFEDFYGEADSGVDLRRLQFFAQGTIDDHLRYSASFNFGADAGFGEVFVEGRHEGLRVFGYNVGQFRLGFFQEPFGFERVMSGYYTGFVERSLPVWTFTPGNNVGYMLHDTTKNKRFSWSLGFFSFGQTNEANSSNSNLSLTARVTGLPIYRDGGRRLLHLGASFSSRDPKDSHIRYRSRPEARFVGFLADTGEFNAGQIKLVGIEVVALRGPLSLQSEVIVSQAEGTEWGDLIFWGGYAQVGYFLGGDHRTYDEQLGVFSRVQPKQRFSGKPFRGGLFSGAWELTGRISNVDLNDGGVTGGEMLNLSFGVNWYLSATSAIKMNYINSRVDGQGRVNVVTLRYQFRPLPIPGWR